MKVGDYVRFYDGSWTEIGQIVGEVEDSHLKVVKCRDGYYDLDGFIKSSPNIMDLIEEGDILKVNDFKDVYTIYEVEMFKNPYTNEKYLGIRNDIDKRPKRLYEIPLVNLSIVTKEQFKSIEYEVE